MQELGSRHQVAGKMLNKNFNERKIDIDIQ